MIEFFANHVDVQEGDQGCQLLLEADRDVEGPYLLLQRQVDGDECYVETNDRQLCGHYPIRQLECSMTELQLHIQCADPVRFCVHFRLELEKFEALKAIVSVLGPRRDTPNE